MMSGARLDLPEPLLETLGVEAELLGFESLPAYFRWIVDNRLAIDHDGERGRVLSEYSAELAKVRDDASTLPDAAAEAARRIDDSANPYTNVRLIPRKNRIEDDEVDTAAEALKSVETDRLDVIAQRAVTQTRERLGDAGTGINYESTAALRHDGKPGQDITDLDEISVPGWDETRIQRRREAVGAALAFLSDVEEAKRSDFVNELYEEYPAAYDSESAWWSCIKRGLRQVDRVIPANEDRRVWQFRTTPGRVTRITFA